MTSQDDAHEAGGRAYDVAFTIPTGPPATDPPFSGGTHSGTATIVLPSSWSAADSKRAIERKRREGVPSPHWGAHPQGLESQWGPSLETPACPPGWRTGPPDFVGVGVQRGGTTWWHRKLTKHPRVCPLSKTAHEKEIHFFDFLPDGIPTSASARLADLYHRYFPRPDGQLIGEWTPSYVDDAWTPRLLAAVAPSARILVLLRDPVERYRSGVVREILVAWRSDGIAELRPEVPGEQLARGFYSGPIRRILEQFPREQVLILQYERCCDQPEVEMRTTFEFLGLPSDFVPPNMKRLKKLNPSKLDIPVDLHDALAELYAPDVRELSALVPELDVSLWPSVRDLA